MALVPGDRIGSYEVLNRIGAGGMGEVYRARDLKLQREVALKQIPTDLGQSPDRTDRFAREALLLASLNHPNIATVYGVEDATGTTVLVMELVEGRTLADVIGRGAGPQAGQGLPLVDALTIALQIADALEVAHSRGIVHRDLKPANVMVRPDGTVKVLDFGLAKAMEPPAVGRGLSPAAHAGPEGPAYGPNSQAPTVTGGPLLTTPGTVLGTAAYMSPEQARGEAVDRRTDIWAFGTVLYELLTGRRAFDGVTTAHALVQVLDREPDWTALPMLPEGVRALLERCLRKDANERPREIADLRADLRKALRQLETGPSTSSQARAASALPTRRQWSVGAAGVVLAAALTWVWFGRAPIVAPIDSIAVLPFTSMGTGADVEYLGDGLTESVINRLSTLDALRIVPRSTVFRYRERVDDAEQVGRDLNVRAVLTGRVTQRGDTLLIAAELVDVDKAAQLWGQQYNRRMTDLPTVQDDIARDIASALSRRLTSEEQRRLTRIDTRSSEAYQLYLKGLFHRRKTTEAGFTESVAYLQRAIEADPTFALAYVGLSDSLGSLAYLEIARPRDVWPRAKAAAETALRLDDSLAEAHAALAHALFRYDWDFDGARREFERTFTLDPDYAIAYHWYAHYWTAMRNGEQARAASDRAVALEPLDQMLNAHLLFYTPLAAVPERVRTVREFAPDLWAAHTRLGTSRLGSDADAAVTSLVQGVAASGRMPLSLVSLGNGLAILGRAGEATAIIRELEARPYPPSTYIAQIYAQLRDKERVLAWLQRAVEERDTALTDSVAPLVTPWKEDDRFQAILRRMGIPPIQ